MFDIKSKTNLLIILILSGAITVSSGFAFQIMSTSWAAACFFCASALILVGISYLGRIIMEKEPAPKEPFSKSTIDTATLALSTLWIETIIFFIVFLTLKFLNLAVFIIEYVFGILFLITIIIEIFTVFAYTKGYTRLKITTKTIPIILAVSNTVIATLTILVASDILLPSLNWGFVFSFSIFITVPCLVRYFEMPKIKDILMIMPKETVLKGKAVMYLILGLALPFIIFPACYFIIQPVEIMFIEWWHIAAILLVVSEICVGRAIYLQSKKIGKIRVIKLRSFEKTMRIGIASASVLTGILFLGLYVYSSITETGVAFEKGNISFLSVSILCFVGPFSFYEYFKFRKLDKMEEKFPDFLRDLAEYWKGGLSMSTAVGTLAKGEYGALTDEVKKMATQISWGVSFHQVLRMLTDRIGSRLVNRSVSLIEEADKAGGTISDVLVTASNDAREIKWLQLERKRNTSTYMMIVYVSFFVYLGIVGVMAALFIPAITGSTKEISGGGSIGGVSVSSINVPLMVFLFFCSAVVQGIGNGIVGGLMSEGKIVSGLRHAFIMVLVGWLVFAGAIYPIAVDLTQPTSSVEHISYWQKESSFDITVSPSDKMPGTGVDSVELFYRYSEDNYTWGSWTSYNKATESPWKFKFDTKTTGGDGHYEFYSTATDVAGNTENRPVRADTRCGVDSTAPKTTIKEVSSYWQTENITFTVKTSDKYTGINSTTLYYKYRANNNTGFGSWISLGAYNVSNITSPRYSDTHEWNFNWSEGEGVYQFRAEGIDCIGNKEQEKIDIELGYDLTPPNSTVTAMPSYWQSETFNVPYTASDNVDLKSIELYYRYRTDNTFGWNPWYRYATKDVEGIIASGTFSFSTLLGEGIYEFYTVAMDSSGRKEVKSIYEGEAGHDKTPPASAVEPVFTYWHNEPMTVTAQLSESLSGVKDVILYYYNSTDNNTWTGPSSFDVCHSSPWEWTFNFPNGIGYYQLYSVSTDNAGNTEELPPLGDALCAYDDIAPESEVNTVNYWQNISTFVITAGASDNISGVSCVKLYYNYSSDNLTWNGWTNFGLGSYNSTNNLWEWNFTTPEGDGYYMFYSAATDNASNVEPAPDTYDMICAVDTTPPEITINDIPNYISSLDTITGTASDTFSGVNKTQIRIYNITGGTNWTGSTWDAGEYWLTTSGYEFWNYDTTGVTWQDGCSYTIYANAIDNVTNICIIMNESFGFDTTPPELEIVTPSEGANVNSSVLFNGTCSDFLSGIKTVEINITNNDTGEIIVEWTAVNFTSAEWNYSCTLTVGVNYTVVVKVVDNASNTRTKTINISCTSAEKDFSGSASSDKTRLSLFIAETKTEIFLREKT